MPTPWRFTSPITISSASIKTLRVTPAMAAGVTDKLWDMSDLVAIVEAAESAPAKVRGPYKKRS